MHWWTIPLTVLLFAGAIVGPIARFIRRHWLLLLLVALGLVVAIPVTLIAFYVAFCTIANVQGNEQACCIGC